ncbi:MAG: hypothetical protein J0M02_12785 [Planctomycetes bacterium]|nr:hypothetical protein [Planctomycetota bacterium]
MLNPAQGPDRQAAWIWSDADGAGRNVFVRFSRTLALDAQPEEAFICLFADARWRLSIGGRIVAYGPGRFVTGHPAYDRIDLCAHLAAGSNTILVEVWAPGSSSFQVMADSSGGFIAWGSVSAAGRRHGLATPGDWLVQRSTARDALAPSYSFAQGPVEILDQAALPEDAWSVPVLRQRPPWGPLEPRSIPPLGLEVRPAVGLRLLAALATGERRLACRSRRDDQKQRGQRFLYALPIRSPVAQRVEMGLFWGPHWVNGTALEMVNDPLRGNRQNATVHLAAGWNLLYGEPEILTEIWAQHIAIPDGAGLETGTLRWSAAMAKEEVPSASGRVPAEAEALAGLGVSWLDEDPVGGQRGHPAREMAWDRPGRALPATLPAVLDGAADPQGWVAVADMGGEFLGHIRVRIDATAGTVLDIASDERFRADGLLGLYTSNPFVDSADRVVLAGGMQEVELFHPRGGRFIQLAVRPPAGGGTAILHAIEVRDHQVPVARDGSFACPDPVFAWTWEASHRTLQACVEDAFVDCPWRERGTYLGDALVESATLAAFSSDLSIARRTLHLFAQARLPNGMLQDCAPACNRKGFSEFTLIWILLLHQLWSRDGSIEDARRLWPVVRGILDSPVLRLGPDGLCTPELGCFIDWGIAKGDRDPEGNACVNAFFARALACATELAAALGRPGEAAELDARRARLVEAMQARLWLPGQGRFARKLLDGQPDPAGPALHANVLMLAFGLVGGAQEAAVLAHVESGLEANLSRCLAGVEEGYLELYFLSYALEGLYRHGRVELAERIMRSHWGHMREHGAWTIWECLRRGESGAGSLCHAWSTTPARWFHERILGVRPLRRGEPTVMLVAPESCLDAADGVVPHPAGPIRVAWRREDGRLRIEASGPPGVVLRIAGGGDPVRPRPAAGTAGR